MTAFWDIAPCCLEVDQRFKICIASVIEVIMMIHHPDDEGSMHL
jgi:hypothetical protein